MLFAAALANGSCSSYQWHSIGLSRKKDISETRMAVGKSYVPCIRYTSQVQCCHVEDDVIVREEFNTHASIATLMNTPGKINGQSKKRSEIKPCSFRCVIRCTRLALRRYPHLLDRQRKPFWPCHTPALSRGQPRQIVHHGTAVHRAP